MGASKPLGSRSVREGTTGCMSVSTITGLRSGVVNDGSGCSDVTLEANDGGTPVVSPLAVVAGVGGGVMWTSRCVTQSMMWGCPFSSCKTFWTSRYQKRSNCVASLIGCKASKKAGRKGQRLRHEVGAGRGESKRRRPQSVSARPGSSTPNRLPARSAASCVGAKWR